MSYDGRESFTQVFTFLKSIFSWAFNTSDSIFIIGNFSMLDFFIALLLLGAIMPILIKVVSNYGSQGVSKAERVKKERLRAERYRGKNELSK